MQLKTWKIASLVCAIATIAISSHSALEAQNAPATTMQSVRTVFHRRARGNAVFTARLRAELVQSGLRFVSNPRGADAILDSTGSYAARGFAAKMTFFDRRGRVIWSGNTFRPDNSRVMAYQRLANQWRARRQNRK